MSQIKRIALIYALDFEAGPLISALGLKPDAASDPELPMRFYSGERSGSALRLAVSGMDPRYQAENIGTKAAVLSAYQMIREFKPDLILNPGTAGAFASKGAEIGDVYLCQGQACFHDHRVPLEPFREAAIGHYPILDAAHLAKRLGIKTGSVSTGNSLDCPPVDLAQIQALGAELKEMEAAAIAWICWLKKTPFLPVKSVTDLLEHADTAAEQFMSNYQRACRALTDVLVRMIDEISGKELSDL